MSLRVGQVVYLIQSRQMRIVPVQVTEEIVKRSKSGETTTYVVVSAHDPSKEFTLEDSPDVTVLENLAEVERHLISNVTEAIRTLVKKAENLQREAFGEKVVEKGDLITGTWQTTPTTGVIAKNSESSPRDNVTLVTLPDGTVARVKGLPVESQS